jgi:recombinational DNA repair protein RecT
MNEITKTENKNNNLQVQIDKKKAEVTAVLQETILSQLALDLNDKSELATKKKGEVAMFVSKLITTKDTAGRPAIMTCSLDSIRECALTYCNSDVDLYKSGGYLIPYNNTLQFIISRYGYVSMAKSIDPTIEDYYGEIVWKGDVFEFSKIAGKTQVTKHIQKLEHITGNVADIVCVYACEVHKDGSHIAEIMTMKDIYNALATAHKSLTDTHKRNIKEMLSKFPIRKLAKHRIQNSVRQNQYVRFEDDYEENKAGAEMPSMEITLDEGQDYSEPSEPEYFQTHSYDSEEEVHHYVDGEPILESAPIDEYDDEEVSDEDWQMAMEEDSRNAVETVSYAKWKNELKGNGYEMVEGSYDTVNKTVQVRKV